jgi:alkaline phosphatase
MNDKGRKIKVIIGGGRMELIKNKKKDEDGNKGKRNDGENLIERWI